MSRKGAYDEKITMNWGKDSYRRAPDWRGHRLCPHQKEIHPPGTRREWRPRPTSLQAFHSIASGWSLEPCRVGCPLSEGGKQKMINTTIQVWAKISTEEREETYLLVSELTDDPLDGFYLEVSCHLHWTYLCQSKVSHLNMTRGTDQQTTVEESRKISRVRFNANLRLSFKKSKCLKFLGILLQS